MRKLHVLMPVLDDWESAVQLVHRLDATDYGQESPLHVVLINDGSSKLLPKDAFQGTFSRLRGVDVLHLKRNLGHQRAISVGFVELRERLAPDDLVVVMDSDGEDRPDDVVRLIRAFDEHGGEDVIFAGREKRCESLRFRFFYGVYRALFRSLTGQMIRYGNYSVLSPGHIAKLILYPETWLNYPAAVTRSRLPFLIVPTERGRRYAGKSQMNFTSLLIHGFSSLAVFNEVIGVRLIYIVGILTTLISCGILATFYIRWFTNAAIPGWATMTTGVLLILLIQALSMGMTFIFTILGSRMHSMFIPGRDVAPFVDRWETVFHAE